MVEVVFGRERIASYIESGDSSAILASLVKSDTKKDWIGARTNYEGPFFIQPNIPSSGPIFEDQFHKELSNQIFKGVIPAPEANTLYVVNIPEGLYPQWGKDKLDTVLCKSNTVMERLQDALTQPKSVFALPNGTEVFYTIVPNVEKAKCGSAGRKFADLMANLGAIAPKAEAAMRAKDFCEREFHESNTEVDGVTPLAGKWEWSKEEGKCVKVKELPVPRTLSSADFPAVRAIPAAARGLKESRLRSVAH